MNQDYHGEGIEETSDPRRHRGESNEAGGQGGGTWQRPHITPTQPGWNSSGMEPQRNHGHPHIPGAGTIGNSPYPEQAWKGGT